MKSYCFCDSKLWRRFVRSRRSCVSIAMNFHLIFHFFLLWRSNSWLNRLSCCAYRLLLPVKSDWWAFYLLIFWWSWSLINWGSFTRLICQLVLNKYFLYTGCIRGVIDELVNLSLMFLYWGLIVDFVWLKLFWCNAEIRRCKQWL